MLSKYKYKNITWVDLECPTPAEIMDVKEEFNLPDLVSEELNTCTLRSKVDYYEKLGLIYLVLHFPVLNEKEQNIEQEFDFVVGKNFFITTRYEKIDYFNNFSRVFSLDNVFDKAHYGENSGHLLVQVLKALYKNTLEQLEQINDSLKNIENNIFNGKQSETVEIISSVNRKFVNFKQAIRHHAEILNSFNDAALDLFGNTFSHSSNTINAEYNRVKNTLETGKEILNDLRITNDSMLTTKTNETIKTLTIVSFTLLPITLITGIFGMNTSDSALIIRDDTDFMLVLIFIVILWLIMFIYFKAKKWL